jgi:hypothetical protein
LESLDFSSLFRRERARVRELQSVQDVFQHTIDVLKHVVVPKAKNAQTVCFELPSPLRVASDLTILSMASAVELNDEFCVGAVEVGHIWSKGMLPAKLRAGQASASKPKPQSLFHVRRTKSQLAGLSEFIAVQRQLSRHALI